ncbi:SET and MYND domain-containing protein 4-like protein [Sarcoptes scabiei]|uniref:SET and MYND domain-containing protein 4-like protein n=1 Tax=Sarcoptes scabiei TaxID=52283 RepID=A0A132A6X8_SARSC|nr:SET and MYND domain-containing protein 4-like protein [Sarcoptes scabiei]
MLRICTNGFCWSRKSEDNPNELTRVASCICLVSSFFNHSCNPNVAWSVDENGITLRALRSIRPGEQLTISYGPKRSNDFDQRQSRLKEDYCFFCQCVACRIDAAIKRFALKCSATENCPGPLLANRYESCLSCGKKTPKK